MEFRHPRPQEIAARDALLATALRPDGSPFPIAAEYPLVLAPGQTRFSHILCADADLVAHANLLPRRLVAPDGTYLLSVGLVGNVATDERWRGRGCMRTLFENMERVAAAEGLAALVLWSDLLSFYQGLGFRSRGGEYRVALDAKSLQDGAANAAGIAALDPADVSDEVLTALMRLRPAVAATVERTPADMRALLGIPGSLAFVCRERNEVTAWGVLGKGCDMAGVVHEWGFRDPSAFLSGLARLRQVCELKELMILCPAGARQTWEPVLARRAAAIEEHPMAIMKPLRKLSGAEESLLDAAFVWGLDSI